MMTTPAPARQDAPGIRLSVVIMAYNEEENIDHVLETVPAWLEGRRLGRGPAHLCKLRDWEVLVVDDGSQDGTADAVARFAQAEPRIRLLCHERNLGMGAAIRTGYAAARGDYVTQLPADGQVPPETFDLFLPHVPAYDLVLSVYEDRNEIPVRRVLSKGYRLVARMLMGQRADYTGTMMFRRALLSGVAITSDSFVANLEFPLKALARGASATLVTFSPQPRRAGESKVANSRRIAYVFSELLKLRCRGL